MIRRNLTPSLLISLLALFIATSGAGYAAMKIPKKSVGTPQLKNSAVTSKKVKDGTLQARDFKPGTIPAPAPTPTPVSIDAYRYDRQGGLLTLTSSPATIFSTDTLPAGNYVVTARVNLIGSVSTSTVICSIANDAAQNITVYGTQTLALSQTATATLATPGTLDLMCFTNGPGGTVKAAQTTITAQKVTTLTTG